MKKFLSVFYILVAALLVGCTSGGNVPDVTETPSQETLKVVTTIAPLYSLTSYLVDGTETVVTNVVPINASEHNFQLTPRVRREIEGADIVVINGLHLEEFMDDIFDEVNGRVVNTSEALDLEEHEEEHDEEDDGHGHGGVDPHIWLSPVYAQLQAEAVFLALIELDPENSAIYQANFDKLSEELEILDREIMTEIEKLPRVPYVVFHNAYHYFEERYGLESSAVVQELPGKEPSADYMANLIDLIQYHEVKVVFTEPQFSPKLVEILTEDHGLLAFELDPLGRELSKESYFQMMRSNLESFRSAFQPVR